MSSKQNYNFSIDGIFTGSVRGVYSEQWNPDGTLISQLWDWRDTTQLTSQSYVIDMSAISSGSNIVGANIGPAFDTFETSLGTILNNSGGPSWSFQSNKFLKYDGTDIVAVDPSDFASRDLVWTMTSGTLPYKTGFTYYADVYRPKVSSIDFLPTAGSGSFLTASYQTSFATYPGPGAGIAAMLFDRSQFPGVSGLGEGFPVGFGFYYGGFNYPLQAATGPIPASPGYQLLANDYVTLYIESFASQSYQSYFTEMFSSDPIYPLFQNKSGQNDSRSILSGALASAIYFPTESWLRMGMDVYFTSSSLSGQDVLLECWAADAFTGANRMTISSRAYNGNVGSGRTLAFGLSDDFLVQYFAATSYIGHPTLNPKVGLLIRNNGIATVPFDQPDWRFRNLTVEENFRGVVTGNLISYIDNNILVPGAWPGNMAMSGSFGAEFDGDGQLSGSAHGIFSGIFSSGSFSSTSSVPSYFESAINFARSGYISAGTSSGPLIAYGITLEGSPTNQINTNTASYDQYFQSNTASFATPATVASRPIELRFSAPVQFVKITQLDANNAQGSMSAYDGAGTLISSSIFVSGTSTQLLQGTISKVILSPPPNEYVYYTKPLVHSGSIYSGSFSGLMTGSFHATSSWFFLSTPIPIISGTLISSISVSFGFGFVDVTGSRTGLILNAFTGSPQLSLVPTPVNPNYIVPGDVWFVPSGNQHGFFYADYTSSVTGALSGNMASYKILATEIPNTMFGGTW